MVPKDHQTRAQLVFRMVHPGRPQGLRRRKFSPFHSLVHLFVYQIPCYPLIDPSLTTPLPSSIFLNTPTKQGTHYFQLASTHNGTATEFTQGERYTGWGAGLYSSFGTMEDARRGFVAMNNALQIEILRRSQVGGLAEKTGSAAGGDNKGRKEASDNEIAQLDISDPNAVAAIATTSTTTVAVNRNHNRERSASEKEARTGDVSAFGAPSAAFSEGVQEPAAPTAPAAEKPVEKRTSIIGAVSSLFTSSKSPSTTADRLPQSTSKDDLISKAVAEESEEHLEDQNNNYEDGDDQDEDEDGNYGGEHEVEDPETKRAREAKNAERIELDLGSGDLSFGDFGI